MKGKNILYGRTDLNMAGPGVVMLKTASHLVKRGNKVIVASGGGVLEKEFEKNNVIAETIEELLINKRSVINTIIVIFKLAKIIRKYDINIVHAHNMLFTFMSLAASIMVLRKVSFFTTIHGHGKENLCRFLPGTIIVVSDYLKKHLVSSGVKSKKITIVQNGLINLKDYKQKDRDRGSQDKFRIINVGMMTGFKGHDEIIEVVKNIVEITSKDVELLLVGDGVRKEELINKAKKLGVYDNICFLGKRQDVPDLLGKSDLFLHLPEFETFGMVVMEAMASGLPVIASDVGGIPELISNEWNGYLVDRSNSKEIALAIVRLMESDNLRAIMGLNSYERIKGSFQIFGTIDILERLYNEGH